MREHSRVFLNKLNEPVIEEWKLLFYLYKFLHFDSLAELKLYHVILAFLVTLFAVRDAVEVGQRLFRIDLKLCETQIVD